MKTKAKPKKPPKRAVKAPAAPAAPAAEFAVLPLADIAASPHNARKTFDPDELARLTDSIREKGVLEPVIVRPRKGRPMMWSIAPADDAAQLYGVWPEDVDPRVRPDQVREAIGLAAAKALAQLLSRDHYELVAGERRYRASGLAGRDTIPAMIRDLDDRAAAEVGVIENDQRADVPPLEQAEGYAHLIGLGDDVETIAAKIGRPLKYVAGRLQLVRLTDGLKEDVRTGKLPFGHAWLLSRLQPADQDALRDHLYEEYGAGRGQPCSVRELKDRIRRSRCLPLSAAPWKWADADLVPAAGPCTTCPKRSGNDRTLFDELLENPKDKQEYCTDRACYRAKQTAFVELQVRKVAEKSGGEALKVTERYGTKAADVLTPDKYEVVTAKEARDAEPGTVRRAVLVDGYENSPVGKVVHIRLRKAVPGGSFDQQQKREEAARRQKQKAGQMAAATAAATVSGSVLRTAANGTLLTGPEPLRTLVLALVGPIGADPCRAVANRRGLAKDNANQRGRVETLVEGMETAAEIAAVLGELVAAHRSFNWGRPHYSGSMGADEKAFWAAFGIDRAELMKQAARDLKDAKSKKGRAEDDAGDDPDPETEDEE